MECSYRVKYSIHLGPEGIPPTQHADDSLDLYCPRRTVVAPKTRISIDTNVQFKIPNDRMAVVLNKPSNCSSLVAEVIMFTSDDCAEFLRVDVHNMSNEFLVIQPGTVIAQMTVLLKPIKSVATPNVQEISKDLKGILNPEQFSEFQKSVARHQIKLIQFFESAAIETLPARPPSQNLLDTRT